MKFNLIDIENWKRKEHYNHFLNASNCTFSITCNLDITDILKYTKFNNIKLYPTIIYSITEAVNKFSEFRTCFDNEGRLGYWDVINPSFTIFNKENETFSNIWIKYEDDFNKFYNNYKTEVELYTNSKKLNPQINMLDNILPISSIPWFSFTGFNLNIISDGTYLLPIFTLGKYFEQDNRVLLPISIQVHHAICDGFHVSRFINELQNIIKNYHFYIFKLN